MFAAAQPRRLTHANSKQVCVRSLPKWIKTGETSCLRFARLPLDVEFTLAERLIPKSVSAPPE